MARSLGAFGQAWHRKEPVDPLLVVVNQSLPFEALHDGNDLVQSFLLADLLPDVVFGLTDAAHLFWQDFGQNDGVPTVRSLHDVLERPFGFCGEQRVFIGLLNLRLFGDGGKVLRSDVEIRAIELAVLIAIEDGSRVRRLANLAQDRLGERLCCFAVVFD